MVGVFLAKGKGNCGELEYINAVIMLLTVFRHARIN